MKRVFHYGLNIVELCLFDTRKEMKSFVKMNEKLLNSKIEKTKGFSEDSSFIVLLEYDKGQLKSSQVHAFISFEFARRVFITALDIKVEHPNLLRLIEDSEYFVKKKLSEGGNYE